MRDRSRELGADVRQPEPVGDVGDDRREVSVTWPPLVATAPLPLTIAMKVSSAARLACFHPSWTRALARRAAAAASVAST